MTDDETREFVRALLANTDRAPRDVVPGKGLTREDLERQTPNYMRPCTGTIPGEVIQSLDDEFLAVEPSRTVTATFCGTGITRAEADRLGIAPGELPGIHVIDTNEENERDARTV